MSPGKTGTGDFSGVDAIESKGGLGRPQFKIGDLTWVKLEKSLWPVQVLEEEHFRAKLPKKKKDDILVRLYGTCEYLYVNPCACISKDDVLQETGKPTLREAFRAILEQELSLVRSAVKSGRTVTRVSKQQKQDVVEQSKGATTPLTESPTTKTRKHRAAQHGGRGADGTKTSSVSTVGAKRGSLKKDKSEVNTKPSEDLNLHPVDTHENLATTDAAIRLMVKDILSSGKPPQEEKDEPKKKGKKRAAAIPATSLGKEATGEQHPTAATPKSNSNGEEAARRTKVLQSLALVPPKGSPFKRTTRRKAA